MRGVLSVRKRSGAAHAAPPQPPAPQLRRFLRKAVHLFGPLPSVRDAALLELSIALWQQVRRRMVSE